MNCNECQEQLDDLIFGPEGHPEAPDTSSVQGHLDQCPACRKHFESLTKLGRCFAGMEELAARLPAERVARLHERILEAVKAQKAEASDRKRLPAIMRLPVWAWVAAAAIVLVALGAWLRMPPTKPASRVLAVAVNRPISPVVSRAASLPAKAKAEAKPKVPEVTLESLQAEFARLKASAQGVGDEFLRKLVRYAVDDARTPAEAMQAQKLIVDTYEQMGERDLARAAFAKYLEDVEQVKGREKAAQYAQAKAYEIFYKQKDHLDALAYYDFVATRYPDLQQGQHARYMTGKYYEVEKLLPQALETYQKVVQEIPHSLAAKQAQQAMWMVLANMGQRQEAIRVLGEFAAEYPNEDDEGYAQFYIGWNYYWMGMSGYPKAAKELKLLLEKYPQHRFADSARQMLTRIDQKVMGEMGRNEFSE